MVGNGSRSEGDLMMMDWENFRLISKILSLAVPT